VNEPGRYRLPPARGAQRWVRHYDDVLLVDTRRGRVIDVVRNFYW
jgi:Ni/Co efflux regulator RcnB